MGVRYTICHWATNRTDPQNLLSTSLDVPLQLMEEKWGSQSGSSHLQGFFRNVYTNMKSFRTSYDTQASLLSSFWETDLPLYTWGSAYYKERSLTEIHSELSVSLPVTNFIQPYLHQFFNDSHVLNDSWKPLKRPFNQYQSHFKAIINGQDIRQIN